MAIFKRRVRMRVSGAFVVGLLLAGLAAPEALAALAPEIDSFSPASGPVGTSVTINGNHFSGATEVKFKTTAAATFTVNSNTRITAKVPSGATTGPISVTTDDGTGASSTNFTVTPSPVPTITSFSPASGPVGTSVTINGTGFTGTTSVKFFNNKSATFTVVSPTKITTTVPSGATTGPIRVTTPGGTAASSTSFKVTSGAAPTITSFTPTSGPVGTVVTINGTNFTAATSVTFRFKSATFTVVSATKITATVPVGAETGLIRVTTPAGTTVSSKVFTVTSSLPHITSFSPDSGRVGNSVTIKGTNFTGATSVKFKGIGAAFTVNSATQITARVPPGAATGRITVTTPAGTDTSDRIFAVIHPRRVSLHLGGHVIASGLVSVTDGFSACWRNVTVLVQRLVRDHWRPIATKVSTDTGTYRIRLPDRVGRYRAKLERSVLSGGDVCGRARSHARRHRHG